MIEEENNEIENVEEEVMIKENNDVSEENVEKIVKVGFIAEGTTCDSCTTIIKRQALKVDGVKSIEFDCSSETGFVTFDKVKTDIDSILYKIEEKGYKCFIVDEKKKHLSKNNSAKIFGWFFSIIGILVVGYFLFNFIDTIQLPQISQNMGYGLLFVVGLLTGFHCIAMCGGFVVGYTAKDAQEGKSSHLSHLMYGSGKLISYTIIGALFGLLGSFIAFTPTMRGVIGVLAGLFLVLFGLKMLNIFPVLRKIQFRAPHFVSRFVGKKSANSSPFVVGLLNSLMIACGPLQAIYVMAAGTGSWIEGAKLLFVFGLGTLPVMIGFGYFASFISKKMTHKILKFSGIVVIILGIIMLNKGLVLTGSGLDLKSLTSSFKVNSGNSYSEVTVASKNAPVLNNGVQEIRMDVLSSGWSPNSFVLKTGVPVRWIINAKEITNCNRAIQVPKYGLNFDLKPGEQVIEFTPTEAGVVSWSCWMGMIRGTFIVKDNIDLSDSAAVKKELSAVPKPSGGSCGSSGGGCGCGMMS